MTGLYGSYCPVLEHSPQTLLKGNLRLPAEIALDLRVTAHDARVIQRADLREFLPYLDFDPIQPGEERDDLTDRPPLAAADIVHLPPLAPSKQQAVCLDHV